MLDQCSSLYYKRYAQHQCTHNICPIPSSIEAVLGTSGIASGLGLRYRVRSSRVYKYGAFWWAGAEGGLVDYYYTSKGGLCDFNVPQSDFFCAWLDGSAK